MTDPLDLDAIVDAKPEWTDAETIARLRADLADTVACLKNERQRAGELLRERDAEIARISKERDKSFAMSILCEAGAFVAWVSGGLVLAAAAAAVLVFFLETLA